MQVDERKDNGRWTGSGGSSKQSKQAAQCAREAPLPRLKAKDTPADLSGPPAQCKAEDALIKEEVTIEAKMSVRSMATSVPASRMAQDLRSFCQEQDGGSAIATNSGRTAAMAMSKQAQLHASVQLCKTKDDARQGAKSDLIDANHGAPKRLSQRIPRLPSARTPRKIMRGIVTGPTGMLGITDA